MNRLEVIQERKQALIQRSDEQRNQIARRFYQYQARTTIARNVTGILRNPLFLGLAGLVALKLPWRKSLKFGGLFWKGWKYFRLLRRFI
jgi:hypothetical protein